MSVQHYVSHSKNVPGDWYTTGHCLACGAPETEAPALLPSDEAELDTFFVRQPVSDSEVEQACRAALVCCVNSLRYGGRNRGIIRRLGNSGLYSDYVVTWFGLLKRVAHRTPGLI